jgi:hypothetical protein
MGWVASVVREGEPGYEAALDFAIAARPDLAEAIIGSSFSVAVDDEAGVIGALGYKLDATAGIDVTVTSVTLAPGRPAGVYPALNRALADTLSPEDTWVSFLDRDAADNGILLACLNLWNATVEAWPNDQYRAHGTVGDMNLDNISLGGE